MNKTIINTLMAAVFSASLGFASSSAIAGRDFFQEQLIQNLQQSKQKLEKAKLARGIQQQNLINEHSKMLHENMEMCRSMKPKASMTEQERNEWYAEHQKIMDLMMVQMMEKEKVMMSSTYCNAHKK